MIVAALLCFTSCDGKDGSSDIHISDPVFGFISEENYDPENFDMSSAKNLTSLNVDTSYYLFISFDITAIKDNDGQSLLNLEITFDSLDIMDGTIEDVSTGNVQDMTFKDAATGKAGKTTTSTFKIPADSSEPKTIKMIVKLLPMNLGESHIIIGFKYDAEDHKIQGSDGHTKNLEIKQVKIPTPELSVTNSGLLYWKNVKNADYYLIYENGTPVKDSTGKEIRIDAAGYDVGSPIYYNIGNDVSGYHYFMIRGFNNKANILTSDYSNLVEHQW